MDLTSRVLSTAFAIFAVAGCASAEEQGAPDAASTAQVDAGEGSEPDAFSCGNACDADDDGVIDQNDECPDTPAGEPVNQVGCAESQLAPTLEPDFPPFGLTWVNSGDIGRPGGLTWTYNAIQHGDLFHIYWILCDDPETPCGISFDGPIDDPSENWQFSIGDSDLPNGILVFTNTPQILLQGGTSMQLSGRLTVTLSDLTDMPIPGAEVATLEVPARLGQAGAEITGQNIRVHMIAEVLDTSTSTWTPYLDYYDAAPTPDTGDTSYMSISASFYSE